MLAVSTPCVAHSGAPPFSPTHSDAGRSDDGCRPASPAPAPAAASAGAPGRQPPLPAPQATAPLRLHGGTQENNHYIRVIGWLEVFEWCSTLPVHVCGRTSPGRRPTAQYAHAGKEQHPTKTKRSKLARGPTAEPGNIRRRQQSCQLHCLCLQALPVALCPLQLLFVSPEQRGQGRLLLPGAAPAWRGWARPPPGGDTAT